MSILMEALEPLQNFAESLHRYDEDSVDRLNHRYSTILFSILGGIMTTNALVGEVIKCWSPAEFTDAWVEYTSSICWTSNTYFIPSSDTDVLTAPRREIVYYQWVPLVLFAQGFLFFFPSVIWKCRGDMLGMDVNRVAKQLRTGNLDHNNVKLTSEYLSRIFKYTREFRDDMCTNCKGKMAQCGCFCGKRQGNILVVIYLITKTFYLLNSVLQLYVLNLFLGSDYTFYGIEALMDLQTVGEYKESRRFPRVTLCDFYIRALGRNRPYTVQCTLPVNLFNEKLFIFIWLWLLIISITNFLSITYWLWIIFGSNRRKYFKTYLKLYEVYDDESRNRLNDFCFEYLRTDGFFLIRILAKNTSQMIAAELITLLWKLHQKQYRRKIQGHPV